MVGFDDFVDVFVGFWFFFGDIFMRGIVDDDVMFCEVGVYCFIVGVVGGLVMVQYLFSIMCGGKECWVVGDFGKYI